MAEYTEEEQAIIAMVEKGKGRKLTQAEINLSLEQAREVGELPAIEPGGPGYDPNKKRMA